LLGLPRDYLNAQLGAWQAGTRRAHAPDCMAQIAKSLSPQDVAAISGWLVSRPLPPDPADMNAPLATAQDVARRPLSCGSAMGDTMTPSLGTGRNKAAP
jgi:cytochrome c553